MASDKVMRYRGVYHSYEEALQVLKSEKHQGIAAIQEVLKFCTSFKRGDDQVESSRIRSTCHPQIVLEGMDATGKSTVAAALAKRMNAVVMSTPGPKFLPYRKFFDSQPVELRRAFYSVSNYDAAREIAEVLKKHPVILDRFWHSTAAYALMEQVRDISELPSVGDPIYQWPPDLQPQPTAVFFLAVNEELRSTRFSSRNTTNTKEEIRILKEDSFREGLKEAYKRMMNPGVIEVDANGPIETVVETILRKISE